MGLKEEKKNQEFVCQASVVQFTSLPKQHIQSNQIKLDLSFHTIVIDF
jgi:hypothetical protein